MAVLASGFFVALSEVAEGVLADFLVAISLDLLGVAGFAVALELILVDFAAGVDSGFLAAVDVALEGFDALVCKLMLY